MFVLYGKITKTSLSKDRFRQKCVGVLQYQFRDLNYLIALRLPQYPRDNTIFIIYILKIVWVQTQNNLWHAFIPVINLISGF